MAVALDISIAVASAPDPKTPSPIPRNPGLAHVDLLLFVLREIPLEVEAGNQALNPGTQDLCICIFEQSPLTALIHLNLGYVSLRVR